jgi:hypothetical protein
MVWPRVAVVGSFCFVDGGDMLVELSKLGDEIVAVRLDMRELRNAAFSLEDFAARPEYNRPRSRYAENLRLVRIADEKIRRAEYALFAAEQQYNLAVDYARSAVACGIAMYESCPQQ